MFALIAVILFLLKAFGADPWNNFLYLGLAAMALHLLVGLWPLSALRRE